jgi:hypothetical protein
MQLSDKRLAANRTNAKKSKGPVTPHGKCISSRNATRHGVLASVLLIEGESRERFNALLNGIYAEYQPVTPTEISLVNKIAASQWRQQRAWAIETASLTHEIRNQPDTPPSVDPATRAMLAIRAMGDNSHHLDLMSCYEHRYDRQQYRAIEALNRLRERAEAREKKKLPNDPTQPEQNQSTSRDSDPIQTTPDPTK